MSLSINNVVIGGNLTRDPQVKFLSNEKAVASFGLALNESYKDKDGNKVEKVSFIDVEAFGRTAELIGQYLVKGSQAIVIGKLRQDTWEKDGNKQSKIKVIAENVQFIGGRKDGAGEEKPAHAPVSSPKISGMLTPAISDDQDVPF